MSRNKVLVGHDALAQFIVAAFIAKGMTAEDAKVIADALGLLMNQMSTTVRVGMDIIHGDWNKAWQDMTSGMQAQTNLQIKGANDLKAALIVLRHALGTMGVQATDTGGSSAPRASVLRGRQLGQLV